MKRVTSGTFSIPTMKHISLLPAAIYKLFLSAFGMGSTMLLHIFSVIVFLLSVLMLFLYLTLLVENPRHDIGCAVILFFGAAWEDLLWAFQIRLLDFNCCRPLEHTHHAPSPGCVRRPRCWPDSVISVISTSLGIPFAIGSGKSVDYSATTSSRVSTQSRFPRSSTVSGI